MKQLNVSTKITSPIMVWVSVLLIAATLLFSFMPIMSFSTVESTEKINDFLGELEIGEDVKLEIPEKIDISIGKLVNAIKVTIEVVKIASKTAKDVNSGSDVSTTVTSTAEELQTLMESPAAQDAILVGAAIGCTFMSAVDFEGNTPILSIVVNVLVILIALLIVIAFIFIIPIRIAIMFLVALIRALSHVTHPEDVASKISSKLPNLLSIPFFMRIMQTFIPGMSYGKGLVGICVTIAASVLLCTVISRLRTYETKKFIYLNVVQGVSIVSIVGFFVYFFNIIKTNVISVYLKQFAQHWINHATAQDLAKKAKETFTPNNQWIVDAVLVFVFAIFFFKSIEMLSFNANRLSCTVDPRNKKRKLADSKIVFSVLLLATYIIPTVIYGASRFYNDVTSKEAVGDASFLPLEAAELSALKSALIGIIVMIVAEIALLVLKKVICKGLTSGEAALIVCGLDEADETTEAPATEEAPVAEEAPATEEAPAEEEASVEVSAE